MAEGGFSAVFGELQINFFLIFYWSVVSGPAKWVSYTYMYVHSFLDCLFHLRSMFLDRIHLEFEYYLPGKEHRLYHSVPWVHPRVRALPFTGRWGTRGFRPSKPVKERGSALSGITPLYRWEMQHIIYCQNESYGVLAVISLSLHQWLCWGTLSGMENRSTNMRNM